MAHHHDPSYPPIGSKLEYRRGDGALITVAVSEAPALPSLNSYKPEPPKLVSTLHGAPPDSLPKKLKNAPPAAPRAPGQPAAKQVKPSQLPHKAPGWEIMNHPLIGGKFTVFVLLYGGEQYYAMHRRCLDSIVSTVPSAHLSLRVLSNELNAKSTEYVDQLVTAGIVQTHRRRLDNPGKYVIMREAFHDNLLPIDTPWLLWFDDDSHCVDPDWCKLLAQAIATDPNPRIGMLGAKYTWKLQPGQAAWYRNRPWHRGRAFRDKSGKESPNGDTLHFVTGGFWALRTAAMQQCDLPDTALQHCGGDTNFGEAMHQNGFQLKSWNGNQQYVRISDHKRRGRDEPHPGITRKK